MNIREEYENKKNQLIKEFNQSISKFEKETCVYLTKIKIEPKLNIARHPDDFGPFPIKKRYFKFVINSSIDTNEIEEIEGNLYFNKENNNDK